MKYSSPQALLNRYFKKQNKFQYILGKDEYESKDWLLTWESGEFFYLSKKIRDNSVGMEWFEDIAGPIKLIEAIELIKKENKNEK